MKFLFGMGGANVPVIKEFEIVKENEVQHGEILFINENGVVDAENGKILLGVAAEDHSGKKELLNERSNGNRIRVDITKDGVYMAENPVLVALSDAEAGKFVCSSYEIDENAVGCGIALVSEGGKAMTQDKPYAIRKITAVTVSGETATVTVEGDNPTYAGDGYIFIPYTGYEMGINEDGMGVTPKAGEHKAIVVSCEAYGIAVKPENKLFD